MRPFTVIPDNPDDDGEIQYQREKRWFNQCYNHCGTRVRFDAGDLVAETEHEGGGRAGGKFGLDLELCQEDVPVFYLPDNPKAQYNIHVFTVMIWRWGICLCIRGKVVSQ